MCVKYVKPNDLPVSWRVCSSASFETWSPCLWFKVDVSGFPTLFFFAGKDKSNPVQYEGARETDALADFIMEKVRKVLSTLKPQGVEIKSGKFTACANKIVVRNAGGCIPCSI